MSTQLSWRTTQADNVSRLEFRYDHAGTAVFLAKSYMSNDQDTLTFGLVVKFSVPDRPATLGLRPICV